MKRQIEMDSHARSGAIFCFERNCDGVEKSFRRSQVTLEPLAMAFKMRNSLLIISLLLL